jgi:hypothetical protein
MSAPEPKPRPLTLDAHILAYLGDYVTMLEESVKRIAQEELKKQQTNSALKQVVSSAPSLMRDGSKPAAPGYTASARNPS